MTGTHLSPLEEVLFRSWAMANGVDNHDDPSNQFDHRGFYKSVNGQVMPLGSVNKMAEGHNLAAQPQDQGAPGEDPLVSMLTLQQQGQSDQRKDAMKAQADQMKLEHTSGEKAKDREHKVQMELLKEMLRRSAPPTPMDNLRMEQSTQQHDLHMKQAMAPKSEPTGQV